MVREVTQLVWSFKSAPSTGTHELIDCGSVFLKSPAVAVCGDFERAPPPKSTR